METNRDAVTIPYFVHEGDMDRMEHNNKRLVVALILTIVLLFVSNGLWLLAWIQYDYEFTDKETTTSMYSQDGSGTNIMGNHNEVNNGTESDSDPDETSDEFTDPEVVSWH